MASSKFSVTLLPAIITLYKCSYDEFLYIASNRFYDITKDILCQTILNNEVTFYMNHNDTNAATHEVFRRICVFDPRIYHVFDIHEDIPGIDHVGIIYRISKRFVENQIPILYINTHGHNMILVTELHIEKAKESLYDIARIDIE